MRYSLSAVSLLGALAVIRADAQNPRPMTLIDVMNVPQIADPQLSPDGRQILFVRSEANWKCNRRIGHVWRIAPGGQNLVQLTSGVEGESGPRWSPD